TLSPETDPATLFDVNLADEDAVQVEIERLRAVLGRAEQLEPDPAADAGSAPPEVAIDRALWTARVALDRQRLAFYQLDPNERAALSNAHAERKKADVEADTEL